MRTFLVVLIAALLMVGGTTVAHAGDCSGMSVEKARNILLEESPTRTEYPCAAKRVKQDIKACLEFFKQDECTGPAKVWLNAWDKLKPQPSEESSSVKSLALSTPSILKPRAPFAKSITDYLRETPYPYGRAPR